MFDRTEINNEHAHMDRLLPEMGNAKENNYSLGQSIN